MKKNILLIITLITLATFSLPSFSFASTVTPTKLDHPVDENPGIEIPVLMYHHISDDVTSEAVVTPDKFQNDMNTLKEAGYTGIFLSDLVDYLNGHVQLPEHPIVITFDDGYLSNYEHAYPIAKSSEMKITISVIGWSLGRDTFLDDVRPIIPHFGYEEMREMLDSGYVDIQNHTTDLHSPAGLSYGHLKAVDKGTLQLKDELFSDYESRMRNDLLSLNVDIFSATGHMPTFFFYPYGAHNENSERVLSKIPFHGTLTTVEGIRAFRDLKDLKLIPRLNVTNTLTGLDLIEKIKNLENK